MKTINVSLPSICHDPTYARRRVFQRMSWFRLYGMSEGPGSFETYCAEWMKPNPWFYKVLT